jgi:hypothetical protein
MIHGPFERVVSWQCGHLSINVKGGKFAAVTATTATATNMQTTKVMPVASHGDPFSFRR